MKYKNLIATNNFQNYFESPISSSNDCWLDAGAVSE